MTIKHQLIEAHRRQDWDEAARLSQEKERLKKQKRCVVCGVLTARGVGMTCMMHKPENLSMKMKRWIATLIIISPMIVFAAPAPQFGSVQLGWSYNFVVSVNNM